MNTIVEVCLTILMIDAAVLFTLLTIGLIISAYRRGEKERELKQLSQILRDPKRYK